MAEPASAQHTLPLGPGVRIAAEHPAGLLDLHKPAGVLSHPNPGKGNRPSARASGALLDAPYHFKEECYHCGGAGETAKVHLLNRLDSPTSGLILVCRDAGLAAAAREAFAAHRVEKTYFALLRGHPGPASPVWNDSLRRVRDRQGRLRVEAGAQGGQKARTRFRHQGADANGLGLCLAELSPKTGRTHQLRVQCARRGAPILGDQTYGDFAANRLVAKALGDKRLFLHAAGLRLELRHQGRMVAFEASAPLPGAFRLLLDRQSEAWMKDLVRSLAQPGPRSR
jgi:23S rRNA-/tRNA-specific pseudouridylate synthase